MCVDVCVCELIQMLVEQMMMFCDNIREMDTPAWPPPGYL